VGDATSVSDIAVIKPAKGFVDAASFVDQIVPSIGFVRLFEERAQLLEALSKSLTKLCTDSATTSDRIQRQSEKAGGEQALLSGATQQDLMRAVLEFVFISSVSVRVLEHILTLDVLGASDVLMRLLRRVQGEELSLSDQLQRALGTALPEQSVLIEQLAKHGNVLLRYETSLLDRAERDTGKRLSDGVTMSDSG
jgi:hypothetical protein